MLYLWMNALLTSPSVSSTSHNKLILFSILFHLILVFGPQDIPNETKKEKKKKKNHISLAMQFPLFFILLFIYFFIRNLTFHYTRNPWMEASLKSRVLGVPLFLFFFCFFPMFSTVEIPLRRTNERKRGWTPATFFPLPFSLSLFAFSLPYSVSNTRYIIIYLFIEIALVYI